MRALLDRLSHSRWLLVILLAGRHSGCGSPDNRPTAGGRVRPTAPRSHNGHRDGPAEVLAPNRKSSRHRQGRHRVCRDGPLERLSFLPATVDEGEKAGGIEDDRAAYLGGSPTKRNRAIWTGPRSDARRPRHHLGPLRQPFMPRMKPGKSRPADHDLMSGSGRNAMGGGSGCRIGWCGVSRLARGR
jgi:hypothetical protein